VLNDGELAPFWIYSSEDGYVYRADSVGPRDVQRKLGGNSPPEELTAVI
jgi:hypothetical protein